MPQLLKDQLLQGIVGASFSLTLLSKLLFDHSLDVVAQVVAEVLAVMVAIVVVFRPLPFLVPLFLVYQVKL